MAGVLIADLETNGLLYETDRAPKATTIWMVGLLDFDTEEFEYYSGYEDDDPRSVMAGLMKMAEADLLIGHNLLGYDIPLIEQFTNRLLTFDRARIIDTLLMSRRLVNMPRHRLYDWGDMLGYPKFPQPDFATFSPEMIPYCERDCRLNKVVFQTLSDIEQEFQGYRE